jgi:hypothetical protein
VAALVDQTHRIEFDLSSEAICILVALMAP